MKFLKASFVTVIVLGIVSIALWLSMKTSDWFTEEVDFICDALKFQKFVSAFSKTDAYFIIDEQTTETTYRGSIAVISFYENFTSGTILFSCYKPNGTHCDVYRIWKDRSGCLRAWRNILTKDDLNRSPEYTIQLDAKANTFHISNNETQFHTRLELLSVLDPSVKLPSEKSGSSNCLLSSDDDVTNSNQNCVLKYLNAGFDMGDHSMRVTVMGTMKYRNRSKSSGSIKRVILFSIAIVGTIGFIWIVIKLVRWLMDVQENN